MFTGGGLERGNVGQLVSGWMLFDLPFVSVRELFCPHMAP